MIFIFLFYIKNMYKKNTEEQLKFLEPHVNSVLQSLWK